MAQYGSAQPIEQEERWENPEAVHRVAIERYLGQLQTSLPAIVLEDSDGVTALIQPAIQAQHYDKTTGNTTNVTIGNGKGWSVPVHFIGGGGFTHTFPVKKGDEGGLIFCSRCIDGWWQMGGTQPQTDIRMHHLSDAFFVPGLRSVPRALNPAPSTSSSQLRSDDGSTYLELASGGVINIVASGELNAQPQVILAPNLPLADPHKAGQLWVDPMNEFVVKQSQG